MRPAGIAIVVADPAHSSVSVDHAPELKDDGNSARLMMMLDWGRKTSDPVGQSRIALVQIAGERGVNTRRAA